VSHLHLVLRQHLLQFLELLLLCKIQH
jgi:hypothetical protein